MNYLFLTVACLLFASWALSMPGEDEIKREFAQWTIKYGKSYSGNEAEAKFQVWRQNRERVNAHNANPDSSFQMELNQFADLTSDEVIRSYTGINASIPQKTPVEYMSREQIYEALTQDGFIVNDPQVGDPDYWDWREHGGVTGVKDQGQCGSCWAFSTTGNIEGSWSRLGRGLVSLSESELVDCDTTNSGCNGGWPIDAMAWVMKVGGIDTEASHPYHAYKSSCYYATKGASITGYYQVPRNEDDLRWYTYNIGPVSVCIDASSSWQSYRSGIYYDPNCSQSTPNHAVLVVGYGWDSYTGWNFWIVKNSWGTGWGQGGYIWMRRGVNQCGIANWAAATTTW